MASIKDKAGTSVGNGYKLISEAPLDVRFVVEDTTQLNSIVTDKGCYPGLEVWVESDSKKYRAIPSDGSYVWEEVAAGSGEGYWANLKVTKTSDDNTSPTFAPTFQVKLANNTAYGPTGAWGWASPVPKFLWHDLLAFRSAKAEFSTDGGATWVEDTNDNYVRGLTNQKENQHFEIINTTRNAARFTWDGGTQIWHACMAEWLLIGFTYNASAAKCRVQFQFSSDGSTWTDATNTEMQGNQQPYWIRLNSDWVKCRYVRLLITRIGGGTHSAISSVKWITRRWGNQGFGSELEKPYSWDNNANILAKHSSSTLGTADAPWTKAYAQTIESRVDYTKMTGQQEYMKELGVISTTLSLNGITTKIDNNTPNFSLNGNMVELKGPDSGPHIRLLSWKGDNINGYTIYTSTDPNQDGSTSKPYDMTLSKDGKFTYKHAVTAGGFKHSDTTKGTDDYVLLAGGGAMALSELGGSIGTDNFVTLNTVQNITATKNFKSNAKLVICGAAASKNFMTRAVVGSDGSGAEGDLYLNYQANFPVHWGASGTGLLNADGSATATSFNINSKATWGYNASTECVELSWV